MLDTIILTLPLHHIRILNSELFQPNARGMHTSPYIAQVNWVRKCVQNPTKEDERNGIYKPRLTYIRRWDGVEGRYTLKIEFSVPKLLFSNNFDELSDDDFPRVIWVLKERLWDMWVQVIDGKLEKAKVSTIHYGKNIILHDHSSVSRVLSLIARTNISNRFDTAQTDYQNWWNLFRIHSKTFQIVFYDKIADLNKSQDRWVDKDMKKINYQMSLFEDIQRSESKNKHKSFDVLRFEIRFMNSIKRKSIFKELKIPIEEPFTFQDAFCMENARKILEYYWDIIMIDLKTLEFVEMQPIDRWNQIMQSPKKRTPTKVLALAQLAEMLSNNAYREVQKQFESQYSWASLKRLYNELKEFQGKENIFTFIPIVNEAIKTYIPLQIKKYLYTDVNNSKL